MRGSPGRAGADRVSGYRRCRAPRSPSPSLCLNATPTREEKTARTSEAIEEAVQRPTMRFEGGLLTLVCQVSRWKKLGRLSSIMTGLFGSREGAQTTAGPAVRGSRNSHLQCDRNAVRQARRADRGRLTGRLADRRQQRYRPRNSGENCRIVRRAVSMWGPDDLPSYLSP